jgi:hypothetical protein
MEISMSNFFTNNCIYELINQVILKESKNPKANDAAISQLYEHIISSSQRASILDTIENFIAHVGKYIFKASYRKNFKKAFNIVQEKIGAISKKTFTPPVPKHGTIPVNKHLKGTVVRRGSSVADIVKQFSEKKEAKIELTKPKKHPTINCDQPQEITEFTSKLEEIIRTQESKVSKPNQALDNRKVASETQISHALSELRENNESSFEFFELLMNMDQASINKLIKQLQSTAQENALTDIDYLWRYIAISEIIHSKADEIKTSIGYLFQALSDDQMEASKKSSKFVNALTQPYKAEAVAQVITKEKLAKLASDLDIADCLYDLVKYLPHDNYYLGKIVAIIPYATEPLSGEFQKIFKSFPITETEINIPMVTNLEKLFGHYLNINEATKRTLKKQKEEELMNNHPPVSKFKAPDTEYKKYPAKVE